MKNTSVKELKLPRPLAFVFGGGAARAAAQVGMLGGIQDSGLAPDFVVGSSTGAINGAIFAVHPITAVDRLEAIWRAIAADTSLTSTWRSAVRGVAGSQSARTVAMFSGHLAAAIGTRSFTDLTLPLTLIATDLSSGQATNLNSGPVMDAVLASSAFPVMMPPRVYGHKILTDGSVVAGAPVAQAVALGAKSLVLFDTGASSVPESQVEDIGWYAVMALAFTHLVRGQAAHDLAEVAREVPVIVVSADHGSPIDLKGAPNLFAGGREAAQSSLSAYTGHITKPGIYGTPAGLSADERITPLLR